MDLLKKEILALTLERQSHVHAIIGDSNCVRTANGVRFNLHKLKPELLDNIREYIAALGKDTAPEPNVDFVNEPIASNRKKMGLTKNQLTVKKRLKARCRQRKAAKQDKSSKIDVSIASEFCDALKNDDDETGGATATGVADDGFENDDAFENTAPVRDDACEDIDDGEEANEDVANDEDEGVTTLPSHLQKFPPQVLYDYFIEFLRERGFQC